MFSFCSTAIFTGVTPAETGFPKEKPSAKTEASYYRPEAIPFTLLTV